MSIFCPCPDYLRPQIFVSCHHIIATIKKFCLLLILELLYLVSSYSIVTQSTAMGFFSFDNFLLLIFLTVIYYWIQSSKEDENIFVKHCLRKVELFLGGIAFMVMSKDSKGVGPKKNPDPDRMIKQNLKVERSKTFIFIRHGESDWNDVFNKGINIGMLKRLFNAFRQEFQNFPSLHSTFIDSPLNLEGIEQAAELRKFLLSEQSLNGQPEQVVKYIRTLRGEEGKSVMVSSSLRRAIATTTVGLWPRLEKGEKLHILSSLQEMSRNIDTYALSPAGSVADLPFSRIANHCGGDDVDFHSVYDNAANFGNKTYEFYGIKRLRAFSEWAFSRNEEVIIAGGHSLWFKYFFQTYLPHHTNHDAKNKKITNSGVVAFKIDEFVDPTDGLTSYRIDPASIVTVYGGFTTK